MQNIEVFLGLWVERIFHLEKYEYYLESSLKCFISQDSWLIFKYHILWLEILPYNYSNGQEMYYIV